MRDPASILSSQFWPMAAMSELRMWSAIYSVKSTPLGMLSASMRTESLPTGDFVSGALQGLQEVRAHYQQPRVLCGGSHSGSGASASCASVVMALTHPSSGSAKKVSCAFGAASIKSAGMQLRAANQRSVE
jgi:hypothetical protein